MSITKIRRVTGTRRPKTTQIKRSGTPRGVVQTPTVSRTPIKVTPPKIVQPVIETTPPVKEEEVVKLEESSETSTSNTGNTRNRRRKKVPEANSND
tara:strand:+ start:288 stop:575 length:288 start_codon:yes stop_codon:yes gene_type:complete